MGNKLYVGNLSYQVSEDQLKDLFSNHGTVVSVKIITDRETNRSKGFGFVEMSSSAEADECIESLNGQDLDRRSLRVNIAEEKRSPSKRW